MLKGKDEGRRPVFRRGTMNEAHIMGMCLRALVDLHEMTHRFQSRNRGVAAWGGAHCSRVAQDMMTYRPCSLCG